MSAPTFDVLGGYKIPVIGLGTFAANDEEPLEKALEAALEIGYRHIDTAHLYQNEHVIGRVLKKWFDSGKLKREDIFVTTKLPGTGVHPDKVETHIKESLKSLQLDYVDLYLIHFPIHTTEPEKGKGFGSIKTQPTDLIAVWKKLEEQVDLGHTKTIGVSNFNIEQVGRIIANSRIKPASNQVELHIHLQQPELVKYCQDNGILVVSYSTFGNPGITTWLAKQGVPAHQSDQRDAILADATVKKIAEKHNKSPAQILLKYEIQKKIAVIPKSVTPKRLKENFDLFNFTLDQEDIKSLQGLDKGEAGRLNRMLPSWMDHPEYPFPKATN